MVQNPNNDGYSAENENVLLAECDFSDDLSTSPQMGMKQLVEKIQKLEKANGPNKGSEASIIMRNNYKHIMTLLMLIISIMTILAFCVAGLLLKSCQMSEEISKMKENNTAMDEQINGLKNETHKMQEQIKEIGTFMGLDPTKNGFNPLDSGLNLTISENRLVATLNGTGWNSVRTIWPIEALNFSEFKPPIMLYYFEVQFFINNYGNIPIGLCTKKYSIYNSNLFGALNTIGIVNTEGIWIGGIEIKFGNAKEKFKAGDVVLGLIHSTTNSSTKCFVTLNAKLLGKVDLPPKFATVESIRQLYPVISMYYGRDSIRANFGKQKFRYNLTTEILQ